MAAPAVPAIYNLTLTNADTEYSQALTAGAESFEFQCRTSGAVRFAFVTGKVETPTAPYMTLKAGQSYYSDNTVDVENLGAAKTLYFASSTAGAVVEIIEWV